MRNLKSLIVALLTMTVLFTSCAKEDILQETTPMTIASKKGEDKVEEVNNLKGPDIAIANYQITIGGNKYQPCKYSRYELADNTYHTYHEVNGASFKYIFNKGQTDEFSVITSDKVLLQLWPTGGQHNVVVRVVNPVTGVELINSESTNYIFNHQGAGCYTSPDTPGGNNGN